MKPGGSKSHVRGASDSKLSATACTDGGAHLTRFRLGKPISHIKVPTRSAVFTKRTGAKLVVRQTIRVPQTVRSPAIPNLPTLVADGTGFRGNPAQRAAAATRDTPTQLGTLELAPTRDVLLADGLHALRVQQQAFFGGDSGELVQVEVQKKRSTRCSMLNEISLQ